MNIFKKLIGNILKLLPDKLFLKIIFYLKMWKNLDLSNPKTYSEKLQWLKLYDRKPIYTKMVDKYEAKKYVSDIIWEEYIIPTLWVYNNFDEIDFNKLPDQFVLKTTNDSWGVLICKDKKNFNIEEGKKKLNASLNANYYKWLRERPYKNIKPRLIIEPYLEDPIIKELRDYKFFVFNWKCKIMFIASNRQWKWETYFDFFDMDFKHLDIINWHPNAPICPKKPKNFEQMIDLAEILWKNLIHVRVDFYEVNKKIYFWELTFFHWSGIMPFEPEYWDRKLGDWIKLPTKKK